MHVGIHEEGRRKMSVLAYCMWLNLDCVQAWNYGENFLK